MEPKRISPQTIRRLPVYLRYLEESPSATTSAAAIAQAFGLNAVQVRKDLAAVSTGGKSGIGYDAKALARDIGHFLCSDHPARALLMGVGNLGSALIGYQGFRKSGMEIVSAFDTAPSRQGVCIRGIPVYAPGALEKVQRETGAQIGIIAVPASCAQEVCTQLVTCGVRALWNFTPASLSVPEGVLLQQENLAASLSILSRRLSQLDHRIIQINQTTREVENNG